MFLALHARSSMAMHTVLYLELELYITISDWLHACMFEAVRVPVSATKLDKNVLQRIQSYLNTRFSNVKQSELKVAVRHQ